MTLFHQGKRQRFSLTPGIQQQRRPFLGPHRAVGSRRTLRPGVENDAVKYQPPQRPRHFHYSRVPQELLEITPQRRGGRLVGCPQIGNEHTDTIPVCMRETLTVLKFHCTPCFSVALRAPRMPTRNCGVDSKVTYAIATGTNAPCP